jgi:cystathionine beta-lyase/cystathionine gamma-synthase
MCYQLMQPLILSNTLLNEARCDCISDMEELLYLSRDAKNRLSHFIRDINKTKKYIAPATFAEMSETAGKYIEACDHVIRKIQSCHNTLSHGSATMLLITKAGEIKQSAYEFIRTHQTLIGALITSTDWQSPSYAHSISSQAGRETGTIYATINDYKRDQHWDAHRYERAFIKENIDSFVKFPIPVLATSSGMAAFTTILNYLRLEHKATRPVLMGKSSWFQNQFLIRPAFSNIIEFDETDTSGIISAVKTHDPSIIFIDSLTNMPNVAIPDLPRIIEFLVKNATKETYLVIDNTGLSVMLQPFKKLLGKRSKLRLIVFESLNKYHQFGFDRVTGGIIASYGGDTLKIFDYRVHSGTNIPDASAASIPTPNRGKLLARLKRHQRNTLVLTRALQTWIDSHPASPFEKIVFPALTNHPSYIWANSLPFTGSYFTIQFKKSYKTIPTYQRFIAAVLKQAAKQHVNLVAGSTFGLNQTRIYLTAIRSLPSAPFIRVSVGTEHRAAIEALKELFINILCTFR